MTAPPEDLNGHLMPDRELVHRKAIATERLHIAGLSEGESFTVRYSLIRGKLVALVEPKKIQIR